MDRRLLGASVAAFVGLGCNALLGNESGTSVDTSVGDGAIAGDGGDADGGSTEAGNSVDPSAEPVAGAGFQLASLFGSRAYVGALHKEGLRWWRGGVAVTDTSVYWLESGTGASLRWGSKADGGAVSSISLGGAGALRTSKLLGAGELWLGNGKLVQHLPWGGTDLTLVQLGDGEITGVASDGTDCFWTAAGDSKVHREAPLGGSSVLSSFLEIPVSLVLSGRDLYWIGLVDDSSGSLRNIKTDGSAVREIAKLAGYPRAVGANASWIYYSLKSDVRRRSSNPSATMDESVASDARDPWEFAVNDTYAYWIERGDPAGAGTGRLRRVAHSENVPVTLASGLSTPVALAVDGTSVYVAVAGTSANGYSDGSILRVTPAN